MGSPFRSHIPTRKSYRTCTHRGTTTIPKQHTFHTYYLPTGFGIRLGKRLASAHRREQRYEWEPSWIRQCMLGNEPLYLRSLDSKSLLIQTTIFPAQNTPTTITSLVDSGCSGRGFIDRSFTQNNNLQTFPTPSRRPLLLADGKPSDTISEYVLIPCQIENHQELGLFFVANLAPDTPLIFGLPWLRRHNPVIDWATLTLTFASNYCRKFCLPRNLQSCQAVTIPDKMKLQEIVIPGEPDPIPTQAIPMESIHHHYKPPSVEDCPEDSTETKVELYNANNLTIEKTLTPGQEHHTIYGRYEAGKPIHQARMIPTPYQTKPMTATIVGSVRQTNKKCLHKNKELPPLSVQLPQPKNYEQLPHDRPNMEDI